MESGNFENQEGLLQDSKLLELRAIYLDAIAEYTKLPNDSNLSAVDNLLLEYLDGISGMIDYYLEILDISFIEKTNTIIGLITTELESIEQTFAKLLKNYEPADISQEALDNIKQLLYELSNQQPDISKENEKYISDLKTELFKECYILVSYSVVKYLLFLNQYYNDRKFVLGKKSTKHGYPSCRYNTKINHH